MDFIIKIFGMGEQSSVKKVNFEDIQEIIKKQRKEYILINVLPSEEQNCLISGTIKYSEEESIINANLNKNLGIIVYGKNANENKVLEKYSQLLNLGFARVYIYPGGLFEWLLLQDIYGQEEFSTTNFELDILKYRPKSHLSQKYLLTNVD
jgi:hypothetical protein